MPKPVRMPFTAILPKGPASKMAGGIPASGPVMEGVGSAAAGVDAAAGAAGWVVSACELVGGVAGAAGWVVGACGLGAGVAGAFCARQTEGQPKAKGNHCKVPRMEFHGPPPLANCRKHVHARNYACLGTQAQCGDWTNIFHRLVISLSPPSETGQSLACEISRSL